MEEWNATTLEKCSTLKPRTATQPAWSSDTHSPGALAYSPDGHSLACLFGSVIVIWDLQTGGVVQEIETNLHYSQIVWSYDGTTIYTCSGVNVTAYNITSGKEAYRSIVQPSVKRHFWLHGTSLQVMTMVYNDKSQPTVNILKIQPNSSNNLIESFPVKNLAKLLPKGESTRMTFSPSTYQISAVTPAPSILGILFAFDIRTSKVLLKEEGYDPKMWSCFSPDGSLLVASKVFNIVVWRYTPKQGYTKQMKLQFQSSWGSDWRGYQLSPLSSMILMLDKTHLEVQHLEGSRPYTGERYEYYVRFFNDDTCAVTASRSGSTVTVTNLQKDLSQCIDTKFKIHGLDVTGNILLVQGKNMVTGWRLTTEGTVDKVLNNRWRDRDGRLWTKPLLQDEHHPVSIHNQIGAIKTSQNLTYYYDIVTGVECNPKKLPPPLLLELESSGPGSISPSNSHFFRTVNHPTETDLRRYKAWYSEGWVKYPEGEHQHQFWLPSEWRHHPGSHWVKDVTTLSLDRTSHSPVVIKF